MQRFAIYFSPPRDSPLTQLASAWLGRDAFADPALHTPDPARNGMPREVWRAATSEPRRYGFHATLKPPFRLKPDVSQADLLQRARSFARARQPFLAPPLKVASLSNFWALTLSEPSPNFDLLAASAVREFDAFRAPPSDEELARRRRAHLSPKHLAYLTQWGYPYVMDEWRFHMTLTSSLEPDLRDPFGAHLHSLFAPHCREPFLVDSIYVFQQSTPDDPFHVVERFPFV